MAPHLKALLNCFKRKDDDLTKSASTSHLNEPSATPPKASIPRVKRVMSQLYLLERKCETATRDCPVAAYYRKKGALLPVGSIPGFKIISTSVVKVNPFNKSASQKEADQSCCKKSQPVALGNDKIHQNPKDMQKSAAAIVSDALTMAIDRVLNDQENNNAPTLSSDKESKTNDVSQHHDNTGFEMLIEMINQMQEINGRD